MHRLLFISVNVRNLLNSYHLINSEGGLRTAATLALSLPIELAD